MDVLNLQQWENCGNIFSSLGSPNLVGMGFDSIVIAPPTVLLCFFLSLDVGILFFFVVSESSCLWLFNSHIVILVLLLEENAQPSLLSHLELENLDHHGLISLAFPISKLVPLAKGGTGRILKGWKREIRVFLPCSIYALGMFSGSDRFLAGDCISWQGYYPWFQHSPASGGIISFLPFWNEFWVVTASHSCFWCFTILVNFWLCSTRKQFLHWNLLSHLYWFFLLEPRL